MPDGAARPYREVGAKDRAPGSGGAMTMDFETYLEARRIESELRNRRVARLERLGPLPDPSPPRRSLASGIRALAVQRLTAFTAGRAVGDDRSPTSRTAADA